MTDPGHKKVLILTYYWPPSGGAGVQRWLKFTKYLREFNYEPVIYTAEDPEYPSIDESLFKDLPDNITVLKTQVWEPYKIYKRFTRQKKGHRVNTGFLNQEKRESLSEKVSVWIRGNWFIPDARKFWIKPSVKYLTRYLKDQPVDLIVSTGPPHSMHLIGLGVSQRTNIPWVADFRDPWTKIDYYQNLMLCPRSDRKHQKLEKNVLANADAITVVSNDMKQQFEEMGAENIHIITNGFDTDDFTVSTDHQPVHEAGARLDKKFSLTHVGTVVPSRNPVTLWKVLSELVSENEDFAKDLDIKLVGAIDYSVSKSIEELNLDQWVSHLDYLPHTEVAGMLNKSQVLLLLINNSPNAKGILTGKFFEYMNSGRPILAIGPTDGETAKILDETRTGHIVEFSDYENLKKQVLDYYNSYKQGDLSISPLNIEKFSRKTLTGRMTELFTKILQVS